jgi:hypothetical protein
MLTFNTTERATKPNEKQVTFYCLVRRRTLGTSGLMLGSLMLKLAGVAAALALVVHLAGCCCCGSGIPTDQGVAVSTAPHLTEVAAPATHPSSMAR